jgi:hypothetical protein
MPLQIHVIVDRDAGPFPFREHVWLSGKWLQRRQIDTAIEFLACAGQFEKGAPIQLSDQLPDGLVEFGQTKELPFAQGRQHPALYELHSGFHLGLVPGMIRLRWQNARAVVHCQIVVRRVQFRLVTGCFTPDFQLSSTTSRVQP